MSTNEREHAAIRAAVSGWAERWSYAVPEEARVQLADDVQEALAAARTAPARVEAA